MDKWLDIAQKSLAEALEKASDGSIRLENLYMLAPLMYSETYKTRDESLIQEMIDVTDEQVAEDWSHDEKSREKYKFHFVSSYLYCFVVAGKFDDFKYDQIMEYVCGKMDLFTDDYGIE